MKFAIVLLVVLAGIWLWRSNRARDRAEQRERAQAAPPSAPASTPVEMLPCDLCGVHSARSDIVTGRRGRYCCVQHREQAEA